MKYKKYIENITKGMSTKEAVDTLFRIGVIDYTLAKVLAVRSFVKQHTDSGVSVLQAMWLATEEFACTYEYVRKCQYYYKDINL